MSKCPEKWTKELGTNNAQRVWDFAEECCRRNRERKAREKRKQEKS